MSTSFCINWNGCNVFVYLLNSDTYICCFFMVKFYMYLFSIVQYTRDNSFINIQLHKEYKITLMWQNNKVGLRGKADCEEGRTKQIRVKTRTLEGREERKKKRKQAKYGSSPDCDNQCVFSLVTRAYALLRICCTASRLDLSTHIANDHSLLCYSSRLNHS